MDVYNMYVGDCSSTFRTNMFRDYEKHPYGTFEGNLQQQQQQRKSYYTMVQGKFHFQTNKYQNVESVFISHFDDDTFAHCRFVYKLDSTRNTVLVVVICM